MQTQAEQIIQEQKETWNKFSSPWKKWDKIAMNAIKKVCDEMIRELNLAGNETVLDIASGTGEPGLSIAEIVKDGKVYALDLSEGMLEAAKEKADSRRIKNFETIVADAGKLPFENNLFDVITCRFGFMFFPDMTKTLHEIKRVTKPGGKIVASVWNVPEKNPWAMEIFSVMKKYVELPPPPPPDQPGMFRCSEETFMTNLFENCGLKKIKRTEVNGKYDFGSVQNYWNLNTEMSVPVVRVLENTDEATISKIKDELFTLLNEKFPHGSMPLDFSAHVIYGEK